MCCPGSSGAWPVATMLTMKPMKLEGALKLYIALYFLAFLSTFLMSVSTVQYSTVQ